MVITKFPAKLQEENNHTQPTVFHTTHPHNTSLAMGTGSSSPSGSFADRELEGAAVKGNVGRVRLLVERDGAQVDFKDEYGWTALLHAASEGHLEYVLVILFYYGA